MGLKTDDRKKDREKDKANWEKGTTKTIGNVKRVVKKKFGNHDMEAGETNLKKNNQTP